MANKTNGWAMAGFILIGIGAAAYGLMIVLGVGAAFVLSGPLSWPALVLFGPPLLGFIILLAKVIVDRVGNEEDDHYSKNVER